MAYKIALAEALSTFQITPPMGCHNANSSDNARLENRTYVLRSTTCGTSLVQDFLNHGRAITLCCTANNPSSSELISRASRNGRCGPESMVLGTPKLPM